MSTEEILNTLDKKGYRIKGTVRNVFGRNSKIICLEDYHGSKFALKLFNSSTTYDGKDRYSNERNFIEYSNLNSIEEVPKIILKCNLDKWMLIEWIEGYMPQRLNDKDIASIANFVVKINREQNIGKHTFGIAAEGITKSHDLLAGIERRARSIEAKTERDQNLIFQIRGKIKTQKIIFKDNTKEEWWLYERVGRYISPSDVGMHNTIKNGENLSYIDFEYSGLDDISKLICDWTEHPNYTWSKHQEAKLINHLKEEFQEDEGLIHRTRSIKELIRLKWCLIIMKRDVRSEDQYRYIEKTLGLIHTEETA